MLKEHENNLGPLNYNESQAWAEVSKRVRLFKWTQNLGLLLVLAACLFTPRSTQQYVTNQVLIVVGISVAVYAAGIFLAALYANSWRCPDCGQQFLNVNANLRNPMRGVKYFGTSASCQNCSFMINSPNR